MPGTGIWKQGRIRPRKCIASAMKSGSICLFSKVFDVSHPYSPERFLDHLEPENIHWLDHLNVKLYKFTLCLL